MNEILPAAWNAIGLGAMVSVSHPVDEVVDDLCGECGVIDVALAIIQQSKKSNNKSLHRAALNTRISGADRV